jgi:hypothetical protein
MIALLLLLAHDVDATARVAELRALRDAAECEKVVLLAPQVLALEGLTLEQRREVQFTHGDCLVVAGNIREANDAFKQVFLEDVDAPVNLDDVEPRITILIEAARADVRKQRDAERAEARAQLVARIQIEVTEPKDLKGGSRAIFDVVLVDPDAVVKSMRLDFRKKGDPEFYALPITRRGDGHWRGEVPGTYTRSANGTTLEWYVTASDERGDKLKAVGNRLQPKHLAILPGSVVAEDLRASERLSQPARIGAGVVLAPLSTALLAGIGLGLGGGAAVGTLDRGVALGSLGIGALIILPTVGTIFGSGFVNFAILDGADALVATAIPSVTSGVAMLLGLTGLALAATQSDVSELASYFFIADIALGVTAVASTIVVTPLFVILDPPEEA